VWKDQRAPSKTRSVEQGIVWKSTNDMNIYGEGKNDGSKAWKAKTVQSLHEGGKAQRNCVPGHTQKKNGHRESKNGIYSGDPTELRGQWRKRR